MKVDGIYRIYHDGIVRSQLCPRSSRMPPGPHQVTSRWPPDLWDLRGRPHTSEEIGDICWKIWRCIGNCTKCKINQSALDGIGNSAQVPVGKRDLEWRWGNYCIDLWQQVLGWQVSVSQFHLSNSGVENNPVTRQLRFLQLWLQPVRSYAESQVVYLATSFLAKIWVCWIHWMSEGHVTTDVNKTLEVPFVLRFAQISQSKEAYNRLIKALCYTLKSPRR